jgi:glycosyltransferase involved in cell wall biosynthesis
MVEDVFIFPFILLGRIIAHFRPLKKNYSVYFFFPFYHTGGAEKVHAQVAAAAGGNDCIIFFTKASVDQRFLDDFKKSGCDINDISRFTGNKWLYFLNLIYRGILSGYINRQEQPPVVFNGQCNFAYKLSPWINKNIRQLELIHSLNSFSYIRIPFLPFIHRTVMISRKRIEDHKKLYSRYGIPGIFSERITFIPNAITITEISKDKPGLPFTVLYSGRGTKEKRVELIAAVAEKLRALNPEICFEIIGNVSEAVNSQDYPYIRFHGNITNEETINTIYHHSHILVLTSSTEGFPMVVMEAMAHGCVILSTAVGDIPFHVKDNINGFLFSDPANEAAIVKEAVEKINWLCSHKEELRRMAENNRQYARDNFGISRFNHAYKELFSPVKNSV